MGNTHYNLNNIEKSVLYTKGFSTGTACVKREKENRYVLWVCKGINSNAIEYTCMLVLYSSPDSKESFEKRLEVDKGSDNVESLNSLLEWAEEKINS